MSKLKLYQLIDSNFPTGMFSQSLGFETYLQQDKITSADTFKQWLLVFIHDQLAYQDLLVIRELSNQLNLEQLVSWTEKLHAQTIAKEVRLGNQRMGQQFYQLMKKIAPTSLLEQYAQALKAQDIPPHSAPVFCIAAKAIVKDDAELLSAYGYSVVSALVQNGVRGIPLGQVAGQGLILELASELEQVVEKVLTDLTISDFGLASPALEIRQMQHEWLIARNFMS